jgi:hypothetical protein
VSSTGLFPLSSALVDGLISVDFSANCLARLVSLRRFEEVDEYILSLPKSHPIHSLSREQYQDIVSGPILGLFWSIRVVSLFHDRDVHDPFNCFLLGKSSISQYVTVGSDVASIPLINSIASRYVRPASTTPRTCTSTATPPPTITSPSSSCSRARRTASPSVIQQLNGPALKTSEIFECPSMN